jgi:hypothetical protein
VNQTMQQDMAEAFKKRQEAEQRQNQGGAAPTAPAASPN